jgi:hypothetical protein
MTCRSIDLEAVRQSRQRLKRLAQEHPEAFDPDRLPTTAEELAQAMARPKSDDPTVPLGIRLPASLIERIDAVVAEMQARQSYRTVTRADAIRFLLLKALDDDPAQQS